MSKGVGAQGKYTEPSTVPDRLPERGRQVASNVFSHELRLPASWPIYAHLLLVGVYRERMLQPEVFASQSA